MIGIYIITSPIRRVYVGSSKDLKNRWRIHRKMASSVGMPRLHESFLTYGVKSHLFEILEECTLENLKERERHYQDFYDVCGDGGLNSMLNRTKDKPFWRSPESNLKISKAMSGTKRSPEHIEIIRRTHKGKISTLRGLVLSEKRKENHSFCSGRNKMVMHTETGVFYRSATEAAKCHNMPRTTLTCFLNGARSRPLPFMYV